jgi:hypothetical protein
MSLSTGTRSERFVAWEGESLHWATAAGGAMRRGSPYMLCGDRCMLFER